MRSYKPLSALILTLLTTSVASFGPTLPSPLSPQFSTLKLRKPLVVFSTKAKPATALAVLRGGAVPPAKPAPGSKIAAFASRNFFVLGLLTSLTVAYICPTFFNNASPLNPSVVLSYFGVPLIFLLSSLTLPSSALSKSLLNPSALKLNALIQTTSLLLIPLFTLFLTPVFKNVFNLPQPVILGLQLLSSLPTTVNMCIALTSAAGGDTPLSITNAVIGNLLGVLITPLWFSYFSSLSNINNLGMANVSVLKTLKSLSKKVLLPMFVGQMLRQNPPIKSLADRRSKEGKRIQECILLSIVLNSFSNAFTPSSTAANLSLNLIAKLMFITSTLHLLYFSLTMYLFPKLNYSRSSTVASSFVISHKTLAFGLPLIKTVFGSSSDLGYFIAPIMIVHPLQLFLGGFLKGRLKKWIDEE
ncbi:hypothetical protein TrVE_jg9307 [Triparma verrucosa]|uniref:Sodium/bile acid cotransporter n=1 Tax=Triparma verrucosa TaxID=1606542 RepID=A0A9W7FAA3_9STRA|nr:hypothetical protein TrVE_jg9307 [Triparma verrucosa]